jgi:hypothetical protein
MDQGRGFRAGVALLRVQPGGPSQVSWRPAPTGAAGFMGPARGSGPGSQLADVVGRELLQYVWMHGVLLTGVGLG